MYSGILIKASLKSFLSVPFVNEKELWSTKHYTEN
jgi:hypothetical protein